MRKLLAIFVLASVMAIGSSVSVSEANAATLTNALQSLGPERTRLVENANYRRYYDFYYPGPYFYRPYYSYYYRSYYYPYYYPYYYRSYYYRPYYYRPYVYRPYFNHPYRYRGW